MTGDQKQGSRKGMRAIPLTQRQRKHSGAPATGARPKRTPARSAPVKSAAATSASGARHDKRPALRTASPSAPLDTPKTTKTTRTTAQAGRVAAASNSSRPPHARKARVERELAPAPVDTLDTTRLIPPVDTLETTRLIPPVETVKTTRPTAPAELVETARLVPPPEAETRHVDAAPARPRRVKVRVRRRSPVSLPDEAPIEYEETTILPSLPKPTPEAIVARSLDSVTLLYMPGETDTPSAARNVPAAQPDSPPAAVEAGAPETRAAETAPRANASTAGMEPSPAPLHASQLVVATMAEPAAIEEPQAPAAEPVEDLVEEPVEEAVAAPPADGADAAEPRQSVTTRKLPTLAIMAALAPKPDARASDEEESQPDAVSAEPVAEPDAPDAFLLDQPDASAPPESEALSAATTLDAPDAPDAPDALTGAMDAAEAPGEPALDPAPFAPATEPYTPAASAAPPAYHETHVTRSTPAPLETRIRPPAARTTPAPALDDLSGSGRRRMWWLNAAQDAGPQERREPDPGVAPATNGRLAGAPAWTASVTQPRPRVATPPRLPERSRYEPAYAPPRPYHTQELRPRPSAPQPGGEQTLVWVGGAEAALCGTAALVAVIALLNGSAGARAVTVFIWAITFALIAALGAGLGHLAWQMRRARLATLALIGSQLGLLAWALALLGPRAALMPLVIIPLALALRGLGRMAAVVTALAAAALYLIRLTLVDMWAPATTLPGTSAALLDALLIVAGLALSLLALASLFGGSETERARARAIERAARLNAADLAALRARTEDDANALRRALSNALRGIPTEGVWAEGALSPLADQVNVVAERLVELSYDREERKRLESATRRLIRNIERAWMGLSWSWPEASGVIIDDLIALLRTPPQSQPSQLPEDTAPTGQVVAPHLYRAWQPGSSIPSQPLSPQPSLWPERVTPSQPSGVWPSLWPSDPQPGADSLALPPSPRWRGPDGAPDPASGIPERANGATHAQEAPWPSTPYPNGW